MGKLKVYCVVCTKRCKGEVLKVQEQFVHKSCFKCHACERGLESGGFFVRDKKHFCPDDYQLLYGVKCRFCGKFVEGEVVTALGSTFHPACFKCSSCANDFAPGDRVTLWSGQQHLCGNCSVARYEKENKAPNANVSSSQRHLINGGGDNGPLQLINGDTLHNSTEFDSKSVTGSKMTSIQKQKFRNGCANSNKRLNDEDSILDEKSQMDALYISTDQEDDHERCPSSYSSSSAGVNTPISRDGRQPSRVRKSRKHGEPQFKSSFGQHLNRSYLSVDEKHGYGSVTGGSTLSTHSGRTSYYRRQHSPSSFAPKSPHFHYPESINLPSKPMSLPGSATCMRKGMQALAEHCRRSGTSMSSMSGDRRSASSAAFCGEDPIAQSSFPAARKPEQGFVCAIERDDWPGPQFTGLVLAEIMRKKRRSHGDDSFDSFSTCSKSMASSLDSRIESEIASICTSEQSGMCQAFLKDFEENKKRKSGSTDLDPWLASRTPSANKNLPLKTRFHKPYGMSPSRDIRHERQQERHHLTHQLSYPSVGNRAASLPYGYPSSCGSSPRTGRLSGYQFSNLSNSSSKAASLPPAAFSHARSIDLHSHFSPSVTMSQCSVDVDNSITLGESQDDATSTMTGITNSSARRQRRYNEVSLEDLSYPHVLGLHKITSLLNKPEKAPPKIYDYEQLKVTNFQLPKDVDRNKLEKHLSFESFRSLFKMEPTKFERLPEWKQNDLKRKIELF